MEQDRETQELTGTHFDCNNQLQTMEEQAHASDNPQGFSDLEKEILLRRNGTLSGNLIDDPSGPVRSTRQVAIHNVDNSFSSPTWVQHDECFIRDTIYTWTERDSNYAQLGWSLSTISAQLTWTLARAEKLNLPALNGEWITLRTIVRKLLVNIPLEDIKPNPLFEDDIRAALDRNKCAERFQGVYEALGRWGDLLPLIYDIGWSLAITDHKENIDPGNSWLGYDSFCMSKVARINALGGPADILIKGDTGWKEQKVPPHEWRVVRVSKAVSTLSLLDRDLQDRLESLWSTALLITPPSLDYRTGSGRAWSDISLAFKQPLCICLRLDSQINRLSIKYRDGSRSSQTEDSSGNDSTFELNPDEFISDVLIWKDSGDIHAIQFITTRGRISPHYGGSGGIPTILSSDGGILVGFNGIRGNTINEIQAIWRHDLPRVLARPDGRYSTYIGTSDSFPFSDWAFSGKYYSASIACVDVWCGSDIDSLQVTYGEVSGGKFVKQQAPRHGRGGNRRTFELETDEYIIGVSGAKSKHIKRLFFITNKGRTSDMYGGEGGDSFMCQPRTAEDKSMRLSFVAGKSDGFIDGLLLVWMPTR